jgi:hypothetical protein
MAEFTKRVEHTLRTSEIFPNFSQFIVRLRHLECSAAVQIAASAELKIKFCAAVLTLDTAKDIFIDIKSQFL